MNKLKAQPAYSLLFAFFIMTIITVVAGTAIQNTTNKIKIFQDLEGNTKARLLAESAAELSILQVRDNNPGFYGYSFLQAPEGGNFNYGSASTYPLATPNYNLGGSLYFIPQPNLGTAAPSGECNYNDNHRPVDHACNWNKLRYGQSVTLPLYADDGFGGINSPAELGLNEWYLRLRTPCINGSTAPDCDGGDRYTLDQGNGYADDDTILFWQLKGETAAGTTEALVPEDETKTIFPFPQNRYPLTNTEIYESLINSPSTIGGLGNVVLDASHDSSKTQKIINFTTNPTYEKVTLQMNIVNPLKDAGGTTIPYLEWQLVTSSTSPIADGQTMIIGQGYYEGISGVFYFPFASTVSTIGESSTIYTLSN